MSLSDLFQEHRLIDLGVRVQVMIPHHLCPFCRYEIAEVPALKIFRKGFVFSYEGPGDTQGACMCM